jgi:hypothetical protein
MSEKQQLDPQSTAKTSRPDEQEQGFGQIEVSRSPDRGRHADPLQRLTLWELALYGLSVGIHNGPAVNPSVNLAETPSWICRRRQYKLNALSSNVATTTRTQSASKEPSFVDPTVPTARTTANTNHVPRRPI